MSNIQVVKRKITGFFEPEDLLTVRQAVLDVSRIISKASHLVRAYYLHEYETDPNNILTLDHDTFSIACNIVQGKEVQNREPKKNKEKHEPVEEVTIEAEELTDKEKRLKEKHTSKDNIVQKMKPLFQSSKESTDFSLSHILAYSINNLLTAYDNNVKAHFQKYPKRYITYQLMLNAKSLKRRDANRIAHKIVSFFMFDETIDEPINTDAFQHLFPNKLENSNSTRDLERNKEPWIYINKMVYISRLVDTMKIGLDEETLKRLKIKSYNPLPFHSSNVPMHARFDTSGILQLLMNKKRIQDFKAKYESTSIDKLNISNKGDLLRSFKTIFQREPKDSFEEGYFATSLWSHVSNLNNKKFKKHLSFEAKGEQWMFDNAIITDGVSASFQVTKVSSFGRKNIFERREETRKEKREEKMSKKNKKSKKEENVDEKSKYDKNTKFLSIDPGKKDILAVTDGMKTICYTRGQRNNDTKKKARSDFTLNRRRDVGLETFETTVLNQFPKNSCFYDTFNTYCRTKDDQKSMITNCYEHSAFRQFKFLVYCNTKSSEMKFVKKIRDVFGEENAKRCTCTSEQMAKNAKTETKNDFLIGWGNWGKNPNVKGSEPTPGIGIKRRFQRFFKTETIDEHFTSQTCPCCKGITLKPYESLKNDKTIHKHHLLRCTNETCHSRWWNRNVVGAYNILQRTLDRFYDNA